MLVRVPTHALLRTHRGRLDTGTLTIGSLFSGYLGLDLGVRAVFPDAREAWVSDVDKGANRVLAHRAPGVPNLGDITAIDWSGVQPVDIITGGSPCQDLSIAGRRAGMAAGTRSGLWESMREAIAILKPRLVLWENVRGALSATAASSLEHCPGCMGGAGYARPSLRALGRVLGDLADLGYDAQWYGLRAADLGACHARFRIFVAAYPHDPGRREPLTRGALPPTPTMEPTTGNGHARNLGREVQLLPTPTSNLGDNGGPQDPAKRRAGGHSVSIEDAVHGRLLPTPRATDGTKGGPNQRGSSGDLMLPSAVALLPTPDAQMFNGGRVQSVKALREGLRQEHANDIPRLIQLAGDGSRWGDYAEAIARHERAIGRPAPAPTEPGPKGNPRLSARFVEWMMMLPEGWVTDVPGITRNEALRALGNGVVPAQAASALTLCLSRAEAVPTPAPGSNYEWIPA